MAHEQINLKAERREEFGKGASRRARREGKIPAVVYGHGTEPLHVLLPNRETMLAVRNPNALLNLVNGDKELLVLPKDIQRDTLKDTLTHLDLLIVRKGEKVVVDVWVEIEGEVAPSTTYNLEEASVSVEADATNLPDAVVIDVSGREAGQHIYAADVVPPAGSNLAMEDDHLIVTINEIEDQDLGDEPEAEEAAAETEETTED